MTMKQKRAIYLLVGAATALPVMGQSIEATDSVSQATTVEKTFRNSAPSKIAGGVTVVDVKSNMEKDHAFDAMANMNAYVGGWNGNSLWGMDSDNDGGYLMLVDGVPREAGNVLPTEIENITFMKSAAATVLYGSRAAKGAILITTKRGQVSPLRVTVNANAGWSIAKSHPEYLGSAEYMSMYNKALDLDGISGGHYSVSDIYNSSTGANPYRYPNVDFYSKDYVGKVKNRYDVSAQISGGSNRARYYTNISYFYADDVLKIGEAKNNNVNRFSVRGNVDVDITDWIQAYINTFTSFYNSRSAKGDYWNIASTFRPNRISPLIPLEMIDPSAYNALRTVGNSNNIIDGKYFLGGTAIDNTNIFADMLAAGYGKYTARNFQFDAGLNINLGKVLEGLKFHGHFATDYSTAYNTSYDNSYAVYIPTWSNYSGKDMIVDLKQEGVDKKSGVQNVGASMSNQTVLFNADFSYNRRFNGVHNVEAMALVNGWQQTFTGEYHRRSNLNAGIRAAYDYANRYFVEFNGSLVHSAKLAPGHRNAFSPSLTLGWRLSEDFFKGSTAINDLMLTASGSIVHTDLDLANYYMWRGIWNTGAWFKWGDGRGTYAYLPSQAENLDLTFIKRKEVSVGLQGAFLQRALNASVNFFVNEMNGLIVNQPTLYPDYMSTWYPAGKFFPNINYNNNRRMGLDFSVDYTQRLGDVNVKLGVVGTWLNTKATRRDEKNDYAYQNREGKPIDGMWGYQCAGIFQTPEEVASWHDQSALGGTTKPGDLKYVDQNGDKIIDSKDQVYLTKAGWYGAPFSMGVNLTLNWKGFTLFALGAGNWGGHASLSGNSYYYATGSEKYSSMMRNAWTPETATTATLPRLTTTDGAANRVASDFWIYSTDAFRLAKVQLTYDLPKSLLDKTFLQAVQVYVSGDNLFTIGKNHKIMDLNVGTAPQYRMFNVGLTVKI